MKSAYLTVAFCALLAAGRASAGEPTFNLSEVDIQLAPIAKHASNFPPQFESMEQRSTEEIELHGLIALLQKARRVHPNDRGILKRFALANALGHNLDFSGTAQTAIEAYDELVRTDANDGESEYAYGGFLSGTTLFAKGVSHLERAIELGVTDAHYALAFTYLKLRQPDKAVPEFRAFLDTNPDNKAAREMLRRIESGDSGVRITTLPLSESSPVPK